MSDTLGVRQRSKKKAAGLRPESSETSPHASEDDRLIEKPRKQHVRKDLPETGFKIGLAVVTILAFVTRFWKISYPDQVVFDEVHFGKVYKLASWKIFS